MGRRLVRLGVSAHVDSLGRPTEPRRTAHGASELLGACPDDTNVALDSKLLACRRRRKLGLKALEAQRRAGLVVREACLRLLDAELGFRLGDLLLLGSAGGLFRLASLPLCPSFRISEQRHR